MVVDDAAEKLSKQTRAPAVDPNQGSGLLVAAMGFLGHVVPTELCGASFADVWALAIPAWSISRIPAVRGIFPGGEALSMPDATA